MTDINWEVVEGDYGEEVAIRFDYDERLVSNIKKLRDDKHWEVTHCTPVYDDNDNFKYWSVDRTEDSLKRVAKITGLAPPDKVWPGAGPKSDGDAILLEIPAESQRVYVRTDDPTIHNALDSALSYDNPDAEHSAQVQPIIHVYDAGRGCAPMGLLDRVKSTVEAMGHPTEVRIEGDRTGPSINTEWRFPHDLRPYQTEAIQAVLEKGGGIVALPTGGGKTVTALRLVDLVGQRAIVFVHTKELLHQWADEVRENLGVEPGVIGDGQWSEGPVTICTMQTLMSKGTHRLGDYGMAFFDECHRTSAAETMHDIGMDIDVKWRIGLSATPWRRVSGAELFIEGAVGGVAHRVTAEELIENGYLATPRFEVIEHDGPKARGNDEYHEAYERCIEHSDKRNKAIAEKAEELGLGGYNVLVNVDRVDQAQLLTEAIDVMGPLRAECITGSDPSHKREAVMERFEHGDTSVLVSTLIKEGVDIPAMDAVILAHGGKSDISTLQVIGRALRPQGDKDHALVVDVADEGRFFGRAHKQRQDTMAEYYGDAYDGPGTDDVDTESTGASKASLTDPLDEDELNEMADWLGVDEDDIQ